MDFIDKYPDLEKCDFCCDYFGFIYSKDLIILPERITLDSNTGIFICILCYEKL